MDFVNSVQMILCQLNTFPLTFWPVCCAHTANRPKSEEKNFQLAEVHLYRSYFLQNLYFSSFLFFCHLANMRHDIQLAELNRERSVLLLLQLFAQDKEIISRNRSERKGEGEVKTRVKSVWEVQA